MCYFCNPAIPSFFVYFGLLLEILATLMLKFFFGTMIILGNKLEASRSVSENIYYGATEAFHLRPFGC